MDSFHWSLSLWENRAILTSLLQTFCRSGNSLTPSGKTHLPPLPLYSSPPAHVSLGRPLFLLPSDAQQLATSSREKPCERGWDTQVRAIHKKLSQNIDNAILEGIFVSRRFARALVHCVIVRMFCSCRVCVTPQAFILPRELYPDLSRTVHHIGNKINGLTPVTLPFLVSQGGSVDHLLQRQFHWERIISPIISSRHEPML